MKIHALQWPIGDYSAMHCISLMNKMGEIRPFLPE
jgi:hypothetical protein